MMLKLPIHQLKAHLITPAKISDLRTDTSSFEYSHSIFPDFYYCIVSKRRYCKICSNFAKCITGNTPFVKTPVGNHLTRQVGKHLNRIDLVSDSSLFSNASLYEYFQ